MNLVHLKGFTILEALISIVLMSIIIAITFSLFNLIGKQLSIYEEDNRQVMAYNQFHTTLRRDIHGANNFSYLDNNLVLTYYDETQIRYQFNPENSLRKANFKTDTFRVKINEFKFLNENSKIHLDTRLIFAFNLFNDTINANYFLKKDKAKIVNSTFFGNENR